MPAKKTKFSSNVKGHIAVGLIATLVSVYLMYLLATGQTPLGINITTIFTLPLFLIGLYSLEISRRHHALDRMWALMETQASVRPRPSGRDLSIAERVGLAVRFYGLYTFPLELANAYLEKDLTIRQGRLSDLQCAMDNMRVPFSEGQLSTEERQYIELHAERHAAETAIFSINDPSS